MRRPSRPSAAGFTLLELMVAFLIFFAIVTFSSWSMTDSYDQAIDAERARQLRMLAERKLGEVAVFERHHDDIFPAFEFDDLPDEIRDRYEGWTWELDVRDVTAFGVQKDQNAPYLFPENDPGTENAAGSASGTESGGSTGGKKGETQLLRELRLRIVAKAEDEGEGDSIEVVTYLPQVAAKAAPAAGTQDGGNR